MRRNMATHSNNIVTGLAMMLVVMMILSSAAAYLYVDVNVSPSLVVSQPPSRNVNLNCTVYQSEESQWLNLSRILILKKTLTGMGEESWKIVAQMDELDEDTVSVADDHDFNSWSGEFLYEPLGRRRMTELVGFLSVTWQEASTDMYGEYMCHSSRFDQSHNKVEHKSKSISLGSSFKPLDVLKQMQNDREELMGKLKSLTSKFTEVEHATEQTVDRELASIKEDLDNLESELNATLTAQDIAIDELRRNFNTQLQQVQSSHTAELAKVSSHLRSALQRGFLLLWPSGSYALLKSASGCPSSPQTVWEQGWRTYHTESTNRNDDEVSVENHLMQPVLSRDNGQNFVHQHFCIKEQVESPGPLWPAGSYCINKVKECPAGFHVGSITWNDETDNNMSTQEGLSVDFSYTDSQFTLRYCCRSDEDPSESINLPVAHPFYLYRHGGTCQTIANMNVTAEFVSFDTEDTNNADKLSGHHPDAEINNVRIHLCYYEHQS